MKKINLKLRFQNGYTLLALLTAIVTFVYQILGLLGITPGISENQIVELVGLVVNVLVGLGIITDPTTAGIGDTAQAMEYTEPRKE